MLADDQLAARMLRAERAVLPAADMLHALRRRRARTTVALAALPRSLPLAYAGNFSFRSRSSVASDTSTSSATSAGPGCRLA